MATNSYLVFVDADEQITYYGGDDPGTPPAGKTKVINPPQAPDTGDMWDTVGGDVRASTQAEKDNGLALGYGLPAVAIKTDESWTADTCPRTYLATATTVDRTCTLPAASGNAGLRHVIKATNVDPINGYEIIIDGNALETIDGALTVSLYIDNDWIEIVCDGSNWCIVTDGRQPHVTVLRRAAIKSVVNGYQIEFDTIETDNAGLGSLTTDDITIKRAGSYRIGGFIAVTQMDDARYLYCSIYKNAAILLNPGDWGTGTNNTLAVNPTMTTVLAVGDVIELYIWHNNVAPTNPVTKADIEYQLRLMVEEIR